MTIVASIFHTHREQNTLVFSSFHSMHDYSADMSSLFVHCGITIVSLFNTIASKPSPLNCMLFSLSILSNYATWVRMHTYKLHEFDIFAALLCLLANKWLSIHYSITLC